MTTTIYITGDRSMPPMMAANVVNLLIAKAVMEHPDGISIITGDAPSGVERAVRYLVPDNSLNVFIRPVDDEGRPDFDTPHKLLIDDIDAVLVVHIDPLKSRLAKSVAQTFPPEKVHYPLDEAVNKMPDDLSFLDEQTTEPVNEEEVPPEKN